MTTAVTVQQKALTLRDKLFKRKDQFESAMAKGMDVERLLRIVFTSAMKTPKILDCTKESIFGAVMQCAQLGLEPILGRAYLIPYNNNKQVNGKWRKVLECQFQPGYQGLIDLARRSNTISDITGHNVYQNDEFDIKFGLDPDIQHRPWYMRSAYQKEGPGEIIGAYCVWTLKDGTKHPEFMPIFDIHKRRDVSPAYQSDVKYNKQDSPWMKWPEDMNLKTVIKHSSKMVPASIEFLQAISYDNDSEMGHMGMNQFLAGGLGGSDDDSQTPPTNTEALDAIIRENGLDKNRVAQFMDAIEKKYNTPIDGIIDNAIEDSNGFLGEFRKWEAGMAKPPESTKRTLKDEIGGLKTTGLTAWEKKNRDTIEDLSEDDKAFFQAKWERTIKKDYYAEGQPGYKAPEQEQSEASAQPRPEELVDTGEPSDFEELDRRRRLQLEFQRAMLEYRDDKETGIGQAKFNQVLHAAGFGEILDVPEGDYGIILQAMENAR